MGDTTGSGTSSSKANKDAITALFASQLVLTGAQTFSQIRGIQASDRIRRTQLRINQRLAELRADSAIRRGARAVRQIRSQEKLFIGAQRAALAAQGIELDSGTALALQQETSGTAAANAVVIRNNAFREAFGFKMASLDPRFQREISRISARSEQVGTLLTGGLSAVRSTQEFNRLLSLERQLEQAKRRPQQGASSSGIAPGGFFAPLAPATLPFEPPGQTAFG